MHTRLKVCWAFMCHTTHLILLDHTLYAFVVFAIVAVADGGLAAAVVVQSSRLAVRSDRVYRHALLACTRGC